MRKKQFLLENKLDYLLVERDVASSTLKHSNSDKDAEESRAIDELSLELTELRLDIRKYLESYSSYYHEKYGPLFLAGFQESRFANQIKNYACLFTSRASNLGLVSPRRPFRPVRDLMSHDHFLDFEP